MVLGLLVLYGLLSIVGAETGSYLYREHEGREPILDYFLSNGESAENIGYPSFLNSTDHGAQVVEFYAPWCGHLIYRGFIFQKNYRAGGGLYFEIIF